MSLTDDERTFVQNEEAYDFPQYLKTVWSKWPHLRYVQVRRQASKLWKARKEWLKSLEPTEPVLDRANSNCPTCVSSFHDIWSPVALELKTSLTVTQWKEMAPSSCWGCREDQPNQLAHMDYGGCLYSDPETESLTSPYEYKVYPLLPVSPSSTD